VAAGEGWSILPVLAVPNPDPLAGLVTYSRIADVTAGRMVSLVWRKRSPLAALCTAFAQFAATLSFKGTQASSAQAEPQLL
jgi:DNA-binding transcriptional LysR family regulator